MSDPIRIANRRYIEGLVKMTGLAASALAKKAGIAHTTVTRLWDPKIKSTNSQRTIRAVTEAAVKVLTSRKSDLDQILRDNSGFLQWAEAAAFPLKAQLERVLPIAPGSSYKEQKYNAVEVVGYIAAGDWRPAIEWDMGDRYYVPARPRHDGKPTIGLEVRGTSMDVLFPEGTVLIAVSLIDLGREPRDREPVIVQRRSPDGLVEVTCKEYRVDGQGKPWLWPRSNDPAHQQPLQLEAPADGDDIQITAVVTGYYRDI